MKKFDKDIVNQYAVIIRDDLQDGCKSGWDKHPDEYTYIYVYVNERVQKLKEYNPDDGYLYVNSLDKALKNYNPEKASFFTFLCRIVDNEKKDNAKKKERRYVYTEIIGNVDKNGDQHTSNLIDEASDKSVNVEKTALERATHDRILKFIAAYINHIKSLHDKDAEKKSIQLKKEWYPLFFTDILCYVGNCEERGKCLFRDCQADFEKAWESCFASYFLENECLSIFDVIGNDYKPLSFFDENETDSEKKCGSYEKIQKSLKNDNVSFSCLHQRVYTSYHLKTTNDSVSPTTVGNNMDKFKDTIRRLYSGEIIVPEPTDE